MVFLVSGIWGLITCPSDLARIIQVLHTSISLQGVEVVQKGLGCRVWGL